MSKNTHAWAQEGLHNLEDPAENYVGPLVLKND